MVFFHFLTAFEAKLSIDYAENKQSNENYEQKKRNNFNVNFRKDTMTEIKTCQCLASN